MTDPFSLHYSDDSMIWYEIIFFDLFNYTSLIIWLWVISWWIHLFNVLILVLWYFVCIWHFDMYHATMIFYAPVINTSSLRRFFVLISFYEHILWFQWLVTYIEIRPHCNNWIENLKHKSSSSLKNLHLGNLMKIPCFLIIKSMLKVHAKVLEKIEEIWWNAWNTLHSQTFPAWMWFPKQITRQDTTLSKQRIDKGYL